MIGRDRTNPLRSTLIKRPMVAAVVYTATGVLTLFLVSAQIIQLDRELGFGAARLGLATATFFGCAALASTPAGRTVARIGPGRGLRVGSLLVVAASVVAASSVVWWMLPIATAVAGIGNAFMQVSSNLAIFDGVSPRRQGLGFGAKQASVPMASLLAGVSIPLIGLTFGWRWAFVLGGVLALILALSTPNWAVTRSESRQSTRIRIPRSLILLAIGGICGGAAGNSLSLFMVPSAVEIGIGEAAAGAVLAACSILVVAVRIGAGWLIDSNGSSGHLEMALLMGAGAVGAFVLIGATSPSVYLVAMPVAVLGAWGWPGVFFYTVVHSYPDYPARASGYVLTGNLTGTLIGPLVVGLLAERSAYPTAWAFVGTLAAIAALCFASARVISRRATTARPRSRPGRSGESSAGNERGVGY